MAIYWDKELVDVDQYINYKNNHNFDTHTDITIDDIVNLPNYNDLPMEERVKLDLMDVIHNKVALFIEQLNCFPPDMYISVDNKNFINGLKFITAVNLQEMSIISHPLTDNGEIDLTVSKEKSIFQYRLLTNNALNKMKKIFISYSRKDVEYKNELKKHLNMLKTFEIADNWSCEEITIGKWDDQIEKELEESDLIVYMLSANFFSSKYILEKEVQKVIDSIASNSSKKVLCVIVSKFIGLDKLKFAMVDRNTSPLQDALLKLNEHQYLPYDKVFNPVTNQNEEMIVPLKNYSDIDTALEQIVSKIAAEI